MCDHDQGSGSGGNGAQVTPAPPKEELVTLDLRGCSLYPLPLGLAEVMWGCPGERLPSTLLVPEAQLPL